MSAPSNYFCMAKITEAILNKIKISGTFMIKFLIEIHSLKDDSNIICNDFTIFPFLVPCDSTYIHAKMTTPGPRMQNKSGGVCNDLLLWHKCHGKKSAKKYAYFSYLNFSILLFLESVTFGSIEPIFLKVVQDGLKHKKILYFCNISRLN